VNASNIGIGHIHGESQRLNFERFSRFEFSRVYRIIGLKEI
jgi:hypothetical protein